MTPCAATARAARAATPFPPLPETIRKQADLLVVTLQLPAR
jgi:hypothetical protein